MPKPSQFAIICITALAYYVIHVAPLLFAQYRTLAVNPSDLLPHYAAVLSLTLLQTFCIVHAIAFWRRAMVMLMPLLWISSGLCSYMIDRFHVQITRDSVATLFEATHNDMQSMLDLNLSLAVGLSTLAGVGITWALLRCRRSPPINMAVKTFVLFCIAMGLSQAEVSESYPPYDFLSSAGGYALQCIHRYFTPRQDIAGQGAVLPAGEKPVVVLVVGESLRADHLSLNGYARNTTPLLRKRANLVNFPHAIACGVFTRVAVPCLLTRATRDNLAPIENETSVISVFKAMGFHTSWFGAQGRFPYADRLAAIIDEADEHVLLENRAFISNTVLDGDLLPLLDKAIANPPPQFIVLHMLGSHWQYGARYPQQFTRYAPACAPSMKATVTVLGHIADIRHCPEGMPGVINAYDNSIAYTDYVLDQVIQRLEKRNAMLLFVSDHGESLGEHGRLLHGYPNAPENYKIPFIAWASDRFISAHTKAWKNLSRRTRQQISQSSIFHSLLGCIGVQSRLIDQSLNLCR